MMYGLPKLVEEMGELNAELGRLMAFPVGDHPNGKGDLMVRIKEEIADVLAAITYLFDHNFTEAEQDAFLDRAHMKYKRFMEYGLTGISSCPPAASPVTVIE